MGAGRLQVMIRSVVCDTPRRVHFLMSHNQSTTRGILEYMSEAYIHQFYPRVVWGGLVTGTVRSTATMCLPLSLLLQRLDVTHVNLFVLDIGAGGLQVLQSLALDTVTFDVLLVNVEGMRDTDVEALIVRLVTAVPVPSRDARASSSTPSPGGPDSSPDYYVRHEVEGDTLAGTSKRLWFVRSGFKTAAG